MDTGILGYWHTWILVLGYGYLDTGTWILVLGYWYLDTGTWILVLRYWYMDTGTWIQVLGFVDSVNECRCHCEPAVCFFIYNNYVRWRRKKKIEEKDREKKSKKKRKNQREIKILIFNDNESLVYAGYIKKKLFS